MAFNPFSSFWKYKQVWMASVLMLCMMTFVLCTGVGGDLSDRIISWFRPKGTLYASASFGNLRSDDLAKLKIQRNIANVYMRTATDIALNNVKAGLTEENLAKVDAKNRKEREQELRVIQFHLMERLKRPRYFAGGTNFDDLLDFRLWLAEADRLNIHFEPTELERLFFGEIFGEKTSFNVNNLVMVQNEVRRNFQGINEKIIQKALADEFRARVAKQATLESLDMPPLTKDRDLNKGNLDIRVAQSLGQVYDFFKEHRYEFTVSLLPLQVEEFIKYAKEPSQEEVKKAFNTYKNARFDPASDRPGFETPARIKVQYVTADPSSPYYQSMARAVTALQVYSLGALSPVAPLPGAVRLAAGPLLETASLQGIYERMAPDRYRTADLVFGDFSIPLANYFAKKDPQSIVSLVSSAGQLVTGPLTMLPAYLAPALKTYQAEFKKGMELEVQKRAPVVATLVLSPTTGHGLELMSMWRNIERSPKYDQFLPLEVVKKDVLETSERQLANRFATANMIKLRDELKKANISGKKLQIDRVLYSSQSPVNISKLGIEEIETAKVYNRYDIEKAPELKPLVDAYQRYYQQINVVEGRNLTPEKMLQEDQFYRMFFDSSESFAAAGSTFEVHQWPPVVHTPPGQMISPHLNPEFQNLAQPKGGPVDLFPAAEKQFLFWRAEEKPAKAPDSLEEVHDKVVHAVKKEQARDLALNTAEKIAKNLYDSKQDVGAFLTIESGQPGRGTLIVLRDISPLYRDPRRPGFTSYVLPKEQFEYPREDMVKHLMTLKEPKEPVKIGVEEIDNLNKRLFEMGKKEKVVLQVLTNRPRNVYYLAAMTHFSEASPLEFQANFRTAAQMQMGGSELFERAHEAMGERFRQEMHQQLRKYYNVEIENMDEARKAFGNEEGV